MRYTFKPTGHGVTDNLGKQLQKVIRLSNDNKFETRKRYKDAQERFVKYVGKTFKLQKLSNIQDKHLKAYVDYLKEKGNAHSYIKTELSGIRFLHNSIPFTKKDLSEATVFNKRAGLSSTPDGRADRAWSDKELDSFKQYAIDRGKNDYADIFECIRSTGMRLNEIVSLKRADALAALKKNYLTPTHTKGNVPRKILLNNRSRNILQKVLSSSNGSYAFTPNHIAIDHKLPNYKKCIQSFISNHRSKFQERDRLLISRNLNDNDKGALTVHGLRHSYAREQYKLLISQGLGKENARLKVSHLLGHGRDSVTYIYLGGV
jgi:integrase